MINTYVSFTVMNNVPDVNPPFIKGNSDGFWVKTKTNNKTKIKEEAINKAAKCYGLEIKDLEICN